MSLTPRPRAFACHWGPTRVDTVSRVPSSHGQRHRFAAGAVIYSGMQSPMCAQSVERGSIAAWSSAPDGLRRTGTFTVGQMVGEGACLRGV